MRTLLLALLLAPCAFAAAHEDTITRKTTPKFLKHDGMLHDPDATAEDNHVRRKPRLSGWRGGLVRSKRERG